ncbi:twin-arginine translocation signal domain-containing protein [Jiella endophytica]|uniref:Twin-arginine translocation signal domain-containing protein n=1 Tax=Jiella endophytica TaxID=2558362 RepID=A0A4Y8RMH3_9HYPH|nr:sulfatase [Jiella endophytica]TFF24788.1 twin-arginine translocation signal domain-containing protein [Jiella endophytica]
MTLSRRDFLLTASAAGASLAVADAALAQQPRINLSQTARRPDKPNVILIVIDTLRRDHLGVYGNGWMKTPALDQLGRQSLRFTRATPEAMPTIPARRSIHSGMRTFPFRNWERRAGNGSSVWGWQHIPDDQPTLAEQLEKAGYETMLVTDVPHEFTPGMNFSRGFKLVDWVRGQEGDPYRPYWSVDPFELQKFMWRDADGQALTTKYGNAPLARELRQYLANTQDRRAEDDRFAARVFRSAARALEGIPRDKPFFLTVDSFDPHEPWDAPRRYADAYDDPGYDEPEPVTPRYGSSDYLPERQLQRMRALYAGEITMTDTWLAFFLDRLHQMSLLDDTVILLTSDHGMALGEHGALGKPAYALWPEMTDTPLFIRHPNGTAAGEARDYFASTHDILPTILSFAGVEPRKETDGSDLSPHLDGKAGTVREHFTSGLNDYVWVSDKRFAMISRNDGSEAKLYDIAADPEQAKDLAGDKPQEVKRLFDLVLKDAGGEPLPHYDL